MLGVDVRLRFPVYISNKHEPLRLSLIPSLRPSLGSGQEPGHRQTRPPSRTSSEGSRVCGACPAPGDPQPRPPQHTPRAPAPEGGAGRPRGVHSERSVNRTRGVEQDPLQGVRWGTARPHTRSAHTHTHATCAAHNTHVNTLALPKPPCQILVKQTTTTTFSAGLIRTRHLLLERGTPGQQSSVPRHAPPWPGRVPAAPAAPRTRARLPAGFAAPLDTSLHASSCFV